MRSNAPCMNVSESGRRCWNAVVTGTGYCPDHQRVRHEGYVRPVTNANHKRTVRQRDKDICYLCGAPYSFEVDHIVPLSEGGEDNPRNMACVCVPCHQQKTQRQTAAHKRRINTIKRRGKRYNDDV